MLSIASFKSMKYTCYNYGIIFVLWEVQFPIGLDQYHMGNSVVTRGNSFFNIL